MEFDQLDIKTIFLYDNLKEEIYMSQPTGFKIAVKGIYGMQVEEIALWIKASTKAV